MNPQNPETPSETNPLKDSFRETKEKAREAASHARVRGEEYANQTRQKAAERISRVSERVKETADRFEQDQDSDIAHYTRLLAGKLEDAATYVRERDFQQLQHEVQDVARRHPALFFGGMFLAGIATARFLKASAAREETLEPTSEQMVPAPQMETTPQPLAA